jgi:hypothetical protein
MLEVPWDWDHGGQGVRVASHLHQRGSDLDWKNGSLVKPLVSPPIQSNQRRGHRKSQMEVPGALGLVVQAEMA